MDKVRLGFVGVGLMGSVHIENATKIENAVVGGVCDVNAEIAGKMGEKYGCKAFTDHKEMFKSGCVDAIMISTPHYFHPPVVIDAFEAGLHVLCEKPLAVQIKDAEAMIAAADSHKDLKFAVMFQMRMMPLWKQLKKLIDGGELSKIYRVSWIITDWFRPQAYFDSADWRGTWKGEGGGVLMNQCPHQLDLFTWLFGMPNKVMATCKFGKYHNIELEDDVSAILEYEDGKTASFITSTGEFPGTNRLEIACDRGRIVVENGEIRFDRCTELISKFSRDNKEAWAQPEVWKAEIPVNGEYLEHKGLLMNFVESVLGKEELVADGRSGLNSLMLANSMIYASHAGEPIDLPMNGEDYAGLLKQYLSHSQG